MKTINKIISPIDCEYGAQMGRPNVLPQMYSIVDTGGSHKFIVINKQSRNAKRVFDCAVPMNYDGSYDRGGAYWGMGTQLRVRYTKDLAYVEFYRA